MPRDDRMAMWVQVRGLMSAMTLSQPAAFSTGKTAPEVSHMGMRMVFMTPWNPWEESTIHASASPSPMSAIEIHASPAMAPAMPSGVMVMPRNGRVRRTMSAWRSARIDPAAIFEVAMEYLGAGETSAARSTPSCRSWMSEMAAKIEANMTVSEAMPGMV